MEILQTAEQHYFLSSKILILAMPLSTLFILFVILGATILLVESSEKNNNIDSLQEMLDFASKEFDLSHFNKQFSSTNSEEAIATRPDNNVVTIYERRRTKSSLSSVKKTRYRIKSVIDGSRPPGKLTLFSSSTKF